MQNKGAAGAALTGAARCAFAFYPACRLRKLFAITTLALGMGTPVPSAKVAIEYKLIRCSRKVCYL